MAQHNDLGRWGEELAAGYLRQKGWYIRHRDWHSVHRDLDIVAIDEDSTMLLIVEVKTRSSATWGEPDDAIDLEKQNNLLRACAAYRKAFHMEWIETRYDTISIIGTPDMPRDAISIVHKENAFDVSADYYYHNQLRQRAKREHRPGQW